MAPINKILVSSADLVVSKTQGKSENLPNLKQNQIVKAKVGRVVSKREAQLLLLGERITAKIHTPLRQGEDILLRVSKPGMQPVFQLIEGEEGSRTQLLLGKLKTLGRAGPLGELSSLSDALARLGKNQKAPLSFSAMGRMNQLLHEAALKSGAPDRAQLSKFIQKSGMVLEHHLRAALSSNRLFLKDGLGHLKGQDMKALALEVMAGLQNSDGEAFSKVASIIEHLETLQLFNKHVFEETGKFLLPFPVLFGGRLKFGQMLIDLNKKAESDQNNDSRLVRVAFLLELTHLGDFLAEFSILGNSVAGFFGVSENAIRDLIEENLDDLRLKLAAHGFDVTRMACHVVDPEVLAETALMDKMTDDSSGLINLVV